MQHTATPVLCVLALAAAVSGAECPNAIACENRLPGTKAWQLEKPGTSILGFTTRFSVHQGETISFKVKTDAPEYRIDIFRLGFYGGTGGRQIATIEPSTPLPQAQPPCRTERDGSSVDCREWSVSATWTVPSSALSGVYVAKLMRPDTGEASHIPFVVRDQESRSDIVFQTADMTWQAYNAYGGRSLNDASGTSEVSYNRPLTTASDAPLAWLFNAEHLVIQWLEAQGYDVTYVSGADFEQIGKPLTRHRVILTAGQNEFVSSEQRMRMEAARDAGVHLAFLGGKSMVWKADWKDNHRVLSCLDAEPAESGSARWRDLRSSNRPSLPENHLTGSLYLAESIDDSLSVRVNGSDGRLRFWRNAGFEELGPADSVALAPGTLGAGWDIDADNDHRPAGLIPLSTAHYSPSDVRTIEPNGTPEPVHRALLYRAPSGALVFNAATMQWAAGLADAKDTRIQQATVNLFADMDVQPATLQPSLVSAIKSDDVTPPVAEVARRSLVQFGVPAVVSGTAGDTGGVVAAVEVSTDEGRTWHPAAGREEWSYRWTPLSTTGTQDVLVRAVDDSGNLQREPASIRVNVAGGPTVWTSRSAPDNKQHNDPNSVELGMKFRSNVAGFVTGIRFFKGPNNKGPHVGSLWSVDGRKLASLTFDKVKEEGWQAAYFASPVPISANTTYVVSYFAPKGWYAADARFFTKEVRSGPLTALADGADGPNGVFIYTPTGAFPTQTYQATNYWVDVLFSTSPSTVSTSSILATVNLTWKHRPQTVRGYNVYRSTALNSPYALLNPSPTADEEYVDFDIEPGRTYYYRVTSVSRANRESDPTTPVSVTVPVP
jgi:hypothetical protein